MKVCVIVLSALCLLLTVALYARQSSATTQAAASLKVSESLSNQIAEVRLRLALTDSAARLTQSNLHALLDRRVGDLTLTSNRLAQTTRLLSSVPAQAREAPAETQPKAANLAALEAEREELRGKLTVIPALRKELEGTKEQLSSLAGQRDWLIQELSRTRLSEADLTLKLANGEFLRSQLAKAEEAAQVRERIARARLSRPFEAGAGLLLQSTGPVSSASAPREEPASKRRTPPETSPAQFHPLPGLR